jgi:hypothetical protein
MSGKPSALGYKFLRENFPEFPRSHYARTRAFTGKDNGPIPKDQQGVTTMGGIIVRLFKADGGRHRIHAECPKCRKDIPAGRLHQHVGVCEG